MKNTPSINNQETEDFIPSTGFEITVKTEYIAAQSSPDENRFVFTYTIKILNTGTVAAQLLRRHWIITDANGETLEVRGKGVVGQQPWIAPGDDYQYTSGTVLNEFMGCMQGNYVMRTEDGVEFKAEIPVFTLAQPDKLH